MLGWTTLSVIEVVSAHVVVALALESVGEMTGGYALSPHRHRYRKLADSLADGAWPVLSGAAAVAVSVVPLAIAKTSALRSVAVLAFVSAFWAVIVALLVCPLVLATFGPQFLHGSLFLYRVSALITANHVGMLLLHNLLTI